MSPIEKRRPGILLLRDVAAKELQLRFRRKVAREAVRVLELPPVHEAVVAGIALEVDAEEQLRRVLRGLHPRLHGRARLAAPVDADQKSLGTSLRRRVQSSLTNRHGKLMQRRRSHGACLAARARRRGNDAIFAQQIVPERHPNSLAKRRQCSPAGGTPTVR